MKKLLLGLLTLSALCASGATSPVWAGSPYLKPPVSKIHDTGGVDVSRSIGSDGSVTAVAITSDTENGAVVIYSNEGDKYTVPFDPGNVHPANREVNLTLALKSQGLSAVAVDPRTHSVYAAGETFNGTDYDCLIKKYNQEGKQIWSITHDFHQSGHDFCSDIAVDGNGDVIVGGAVSNRLSEIYMAKLAKFGANGNFLTSNNMDDENCGPTTPCQSQIIKISVGDDGRIVALVKREMLFWWIGIWNTNLQKMPGGVANYNVKISPLFSAQDLAVDADGNFYVVGWGTVVEDGYRKMSHTLMRFDKTSNVTCHDSQLFGSHSTYHDWNDGWNGVTVTNNGHAYVTGSDQQDIIVMEYDAACAPQWNDSAGTIDPLLYDGGGVDIGNDIAIDSNGDLHITGQGGPSNNTHALTLKYSHL